MLFYPSNSKYLGNASNGTNCLVNYVSFGAKEPAVGAPTSISDMTGAARLSAVQNLPGASSRFSVRASSVWKTIEAGSPFTGLGGRNSSIHRWGLETLEPDILPLLSQLDAADAPACSRFPASAGL